MIKIGGSLLFPDHHMDVSRVKHILEAVGSLQGWKAVVIGAGKALHELVFEYDLTDKPKNPSNFEKRFVGYHIVDSEVEKNIETIASLLSMKPVPPRHLFVKGGDHFVWSNASVIRRGGFVTGGGLIVDTNVLVSASSSDTMSAYIAKVTNSRLVIFSDSGVIVDGKLVDEFKVSNYAHPHVMGGMRDKLRRIKFAVESGVESYIVNGLDPVAVKKILFDKELVNGTKVVP